MKVLLMGAGGQGGPCASILSRDKDVKKIVIGDINVEHASKISKRINSKKIEIRKVDASNVDEIAQAAEGMDVVIDLVTAKYYFNVMQGALKAKVNYINTAFDKSMWDNKLELGKKPKLHDQFIAVDKTALLGCGMSSGYTNVIARLYVDKCDTVKSIKVRLAKMDTSIGKFGDAVTAWNPGWDPRQALLDFKLPATVFRNRKYEYKTDPFSEIEEWEFPAPFNKVPVSLHAHEEPYTIPLSFADKGLEYCDFKYYVNMQIAPIISLGLASEDPINVGSVEVKPIDVVLSMVPKPGDYFLDEDPGQFEYKDKTTFVALMVEVIGKKDGMELQYKVFIPTMEAPRQENYSIFGTSKIAVALPAVVGAKMLLRSNHKNGVIYPHDLNPNEFLDTMSSMGFKHRFYEV